MNAALVRNRAGICSGSGPQFDPHISPPWSRPACNRGPSGHILTGPIFVNEAMPGDVLELRILEIDFAVDYGFNLHIALLLQLAARKKIRALSPELGMLSLTGEWCLSAKFAP
jgi:hypothetical protein